MQLYGLLRKPALLRTVELDGRVVRFAVQGWDEYWGEPRSQLREHIGHLKCGWQTYASSGCDVSQAEPYCRAYLDLVREAVRGWGFFGDAGRTLVSRILGLEIF
ncbi:MAG: hypothetical protein ACYTFI_12930, partial [Planctomycetota bacterium]